MSVVEQPSSIRSCLVMGLGQLGRFSKASRYCTAMVLSETGRTRRDQQHPFLPHRHGVGHSWCKAAERKLQPGSLHGKGLSMPRLMSNQRL